MGFETGATGAGILPLTGSAILPYTSLPRPCAAGAGAFCWFAVVEGADGETDSDRQYQYAPPTIIRRTRMTMAMIIDLGIGFIFTIISNRVYWKPELIPTI
jgi:hypothetical protein